MVDLAVHRCNHSRLSALYDTLCAAAGLPRIFCEAFDSGRSGSLAAIKVVESDDVRTARPIALDFDALVRMGGTPAPPPLQVRVGCAAVAAALLCHFERAENS
jgi:hypothetical protein